MATIPGSQQHPFGDPGQCNDSPQGAFASESPESTLMRCTPLLISPHSVSAEGCLQWPCLAKRPAAAIGCVYESATCGLLQAFRSQQWCASRWAAASGCCSLVRPATFAGSLRGAAASAGFHTGDVVVSVPRKLLISAATARQSDLVSRSPMPATPQPEVAHSHNVCSVIQPVRQAQAH
jgi:hypothetical protein